MGYKYSNQLYSSSLWQCQELCRPPPTNLCAWGQSSATEADFALILVVIYHTGHAMFRLGENPSRKAQGFRSTSQPKILNGGWQACQFNA